MRYLILSFLLICMGFQCYDEFEYDGDERYILKGKVVDVNNNPVPNIRVGLSGISDRYYDIFELRNTTTDEDGNFEIILANSNNTVYLFNINSILGVNQNLNESINRSFGETSVAFNIGNIQNFEFELQKPIVIGERSELILECITSSPGITSINFDINAENINLLGGEISRTVYCNNSKPVSVPRNKWLVYTYTDRTLGSFNTVTDSIFVDKELVTITL